MSPGCLDGELNRYLCDNAKSGQFATFFYGVFDLVQSTFVFSNAGHCPALLLKRDFTDRLGEGGMPLGVDPEQRYEEALVRIDAGDMFCLYTDGVTEQAAADDDQFGEQRLIDFLRANKNLSLSEMQESLFAAVIGFGDGRQDDDFTTIIARHKGDYSPQHHS